MAARTGISAMDEEQHDLKELDKALRSAFPTRGNLERMLMYQLAWSLNDIVGETAGPKEAVPDRPYS